MWFRYFKTKIANLFASSGDPDQTPHSAGSDLVLHCLQITLLAIRLNRFDTVIWLLNPTGIKNEPLWQKTYPLKCAPSEDSDQPCAFVQSDQSISIFIVRRKKLNTLGYPKRVQWRFWSDCTNVQADLNLHWAHTSVREYVFWRCDSNWAHTAICVMRVHLPDLP